MNFEEISEKAKNCKICIYFGELINIVSITDDMHMKPSGIGHWLLNIVLHCVPKSIPDIFYCNLKQIIRF